MAQFKSFKEFLFEYVTRESTFEEYTIEALNAIKKANPYGIVTTIRGDSYGAELLELLQTFTSYTEEGFNKIRHTIMKLSTHHPEFNDLYYLFNGVEAGDIKSSMHRTTQQLGEDLINDVAEFILSRN